MDAGRWQLVKRLFHEALERPRRERPGFLRDACGTDAALYLEVDTLLEAHERAGNLIARPAALEAGIRFGSFEIREMLGSGGMGDVYRARDLRLGRDVAIKLLPVAFTGDPERRARLEREARLLAALNHPNIATIHGIEDTDDLCGLVMEVVEGETLADVIARSGACVPVDQALAVAYQIADALEAAHEKGIVHRDLKPSNIRITPAGVVKVLDFGLAKFVEVDDRSRSDQTDSAVTQIDRSGVGAILGTAAYMSPEQACGQPVDRRTDIWAFGCVLYEMLSGRRAFSGEDRSATIAKVLKEAPEWHHLPAVLPRRIGIALRACLQKDARERLGDMQSVRLALQGAFETSAVDADPIRGHVGFHAIALWVLATVAGVGLVGAAVWRIARAESATGTVVRMDVTPSAAAALRVQGLNRDVTLTRDGSRIIYRGQNQLFVRALDELTPSVLAGGVAPEDVFVSAGNWVGFFDGDLIRKVPLNGGPPVTITTAAGTPRGGTWGDDGTIVFATSELDSGLRRVPETGGEPALLTTPDIARGELDHVWPEFLPRGRGVLFTITARQGGLENAQIAVLDFRTNTHKVLLRGGSHAQYVATGHLVYGAGGTLYIVPFDASRLEVLGTPTPVLREVMQTPAGAVNAVIAANGTLVYVAGRLGGAVRSLVWVNRLGREDPLDVPLRAYEYPRISPDGSRIAVNIRDEEQDVWIWDLARRTFSRVTFDPAPDFYPVWSPDGGRLIFASQRNGAPNLYYQPADGTGMVERLTRSNQFQFPYLATVKPSEVIFREGENDDLMAVPLQPDARPRPLIQTRFEERNADLAPNGRWLAHESNESGRDEVYVRPFPDVDRARWQVSTGGGRIPAWSRDGRELFYLSPDGALMAIRVEPGRSWRSGTPVPLLKGPYFYGRSGLGRTFDVAPDGRFLMIKEGSNSEASAPQLRVVLNWTAALGPGR